MLLAAILGALLLVALGTVLFNRVGAEYRSLNDADQQLLREFSQYCEQTQRADIWNGTATIPPPAAVRTAASARC